MFLDFLKSLSDIINKCSSILNILTILISFYDNPKILSIFETYYCIYKHIIIKKNSMVETKKISTFYSDLSLKLFVVKLYLFFYFY